jgi:hydroxybutyrate-dimer hydrolase
VRLALYAINQRSAKRTQAANASRRLQPGNTLVIASSVSNGGGAAIAAAEQDTEGLIDGVAVSEPAIEMPANAGVTVQRGSAAGHRRART